MKLNSLPTLIFPCLFVYLFTPYVYSMDQYTFSNADEQKSFVLKLLPLEVILRILNTKKAVTTINNVLLLRRTCKLMYETFNLETRDLLVNKCFLSGTMSQDKDRLLNLSMERVKFESDILETDSPELYLFSMPKVKDISLFLCISSPRTTKYYPLLLKRGANIHAKDEKGDTPLHKASWYGNLQAVEFLLESGASVHVTNLSNETPHKIIETYFPFPSPVVKRIKDLLTGKITVEKSRINPPKINASSYNT